MNNNEKKSLVFIKRMLVMLLCMGVMFSYPSLAFADNGNTEVTTYEQLKSAVAAASGATTLTISADIVVSEDIELPAGANITLVDKSGQKLSATSLKNIKVPTGSSLTLDGGLTLDSVRVDVSGTFTMTGGTIQNCEGTKDGGGVIVNSGGTMSMKGGTISKCTATLRGGGIYSEGKLTIDGGTITENATTYSGSTNSCLSGAGIAAGGSGTLTIKSGNVTNNTSVGYGGGILVYEDAVMLIEKATITGNKASDGGGIAVESTKQAEIVSATISNNKAQVGAGIYVAGTNGNSYSSLLKMTNVYIADSYADNRGGGIWNCPVGLSSISSTEGLCMTNCTAGTDGDYFFSTRSGAYVANRILGGGLVVWYKDTAEHRYTTGDEPADYSYYQNAGIVGIHGVISESDVTKAKSVAKIVMENNVASINGGSIANNGELTIGEENMDINYTLTKNWKGDTAAKRPTSITVKLYQDGNAWSEQTLTAANEWKCEFRDLPKYISYIDGTTHDYTYSIRETAVPQYDTTYSTPELDNDGNYAVTLTNTYNGKETKKVTFSKAACDALDKELPGATLQVVKGESDDGQEVAIWTSSSTAKQIELEYGTTYTFVEKTAPEGYTKAKSITFRLTDNGALEVKNGSNWDKVTGNTIQMIDALAPVISDLDPVETTFLTGTKTLTENGTAKDMTADQFKFTVKESVSNGATATGASFEPAMAADGKITFITKKLKLETAGTYKYTISEVAENNAGYTYDKNSYTVTYTVSKEGDKLIASDPIIQKINENGTATDATTVAFENTYKTPENPTINNGDDPNTPGSTPDSTSENSTDSSAVSTGDESHTTGWALVILASLVGIGAIAVRTLRRKEESE